MEEPVLGWIDPDLLDEECEDCVCTLCLGVMLEPTHGCAEGHVFCRSCYVKALRFKKECPTCRRPVEDERTLVLIRPLQGMNPEP